MVKTLFISELPDSDIISKAHFKTPLRRQFQDTYFREVCSRRFCQDTLSATQAFQDTFKSVLFSSRLGQDTFSRTTFARQPFSEACEWECACDRGSGCLRLWLSDARSHLWPPRQAAKAAYSVCRPCSSKRSLCSGTWCLCSLI